MPAAHQDDADQPEPQDFERLIAELEQIVTQLERGELALEDSLRAFERGMGLSRRADAILAAAEARVETLLRGDDPAATAPLTVDSGG